MQATALCLSLLPSTLLEESPEKDFCLTKSFATTDFHSMINIVVKHVGYLLLFSV